MILDRKKLRRQLREQRNSLTPHEQHRSALAVAQQVFALPEFLEAQHLAFYMAHDGELNPQLMMQQTTRLNKQMYLPVLSAETKQLAFYRYCMNDALMPNSFGIEEPDRNQFQILTSELDLVFLPLVAFDLQGNRLGRGAGYYDRTFSFLKNTAIQKPLLIGLAYEFQKIDFIDTHIWDIPLHAVVTENKVYRCTV